jgi:hypothetical protein
MKISRLLFLTCLLSALWAAVPAVAQQADHPRPVFDAVSDSPVRLRYQFPEHGDTAFTLSISVVQGETPPPADGPPKYTIIMTGRYRTAQPAAKEAALVEYVITRLTCASNAPTPEFYDTADPADPPQELAMFWQIVNQPIMVRVGNDGAIHEIDSRALIEALGAAGLGALAPGMVSFIELLPRFMFIPMPDRPLKAGDTHTADIKAGPGSATDMATIFGSFRLASVSADKKRALLEPIVSFDYPEMEFGDSSVGGWLVFGLDQGAILDMYVFIHLNVSQNLSDPGTNTVFDTETAYSTSR